MCRTEMQRFASKITLPTNGDGCWLWAAARTSRGYGHFHLGKKRQVLAHRLAYEKFIGPIPEGLDLDHLCRNVRCVNPNHLEPVTHRVNILRGTGFAAVHAQKTHCKWGHEYTEENTILIPGGRTCRECRKIRERERSQRRRDSDPAVRAYHKAYLREWRAKRRHLRSLDR